MFSHCTVCRWTEGFRTGKASFQEGHRPGRPVLVRNEQTVFFCVEKIEENQHITIREVCDSCAVSTDTAERIVI